MLQAAFRGQRTREALRRSGGINYWILSWDEEEEREAYYNTFTGEKTWYKPAEMDLFHVEAQQPNEATKWVEEWDTTAGAYFYYNTRTGEYRWEKPTDFDVDLGEEVQGEGLEWFEQKKAESARNLGAAIEDDGSTGGGSGTAADDDYLASQPKTGRSIYAWEELIDEETERTYYLNSETGETRWSLPPRDALSGQSGLRVTQALMAENPLWQGVAGEPIDVPETGSFRPVNLEDTAVPVVGDGEHEGDDEAVDASPDVDVDVDVGTGTTAVVLFDAHQGDIEPYENALPGGVDDGGGDGGGNPDALPEDWEEVHDEESGSNFFYNAVTGESRWDRPVMQRVRRMAQITAAFSSQSTATAGASGSLGAQSELALVTTTPEAGLLDGDPRSAADADGAELGGAVVSNDVQEVPTAGDEAFTDDNPAEARDDTTHVLSANAVPDSTPSAAAGNAVVDVVAVGNGVEDGADVAESSAVDASGEAAAEPVPSSHLASESQTAEVAVDATDADVAAQSADADVAGAGLLQFGDETIVEQPADGTDGNDDHTALLEQAAQWEEILDEEAGVPYYYNSITGESRWDVPEDMLAAIRAAAAAVAGESSTGAANGDNNASTALVVAEPLPEAASKWEALVNGDGVTYYYNSETGETSAERPLDFEDAASAEAVAAAEAADVQAHDDLEGDAEAVENWEKVVDDTGDNYYYNRATGESRWSLPRHMLLAMSAIHAINGWGTSPAAAGGAAADAGIVVDATDSSAADDWELVEEEDGTVYYYSPQTGATTYRDPFAEGGEAAEYATDYAGAEGEAPADYDYA